MKTKLLFLFLIFSTMCFSQLDNKFYQPSKTMKPIENLDFTEFKIPVENDTISGVFIKPNGFPKATILFFHGAAGNVSTYTFMTKPLVEAGYQVLMIDFRGYGKSSGIPTHKNIESDGQKFLEYALSLEQTKGKPVIIYGASMGSQIATHLTKSNQKTIDALVLDGCISSFSDVASHFAPDYASFLKTIPFPYSAKEDIKEIVIPKLFIHSEGDQTIPLEEGQMVFDNASMPKTFLKYEGDHLEAMLKIKQEVIKNMDALLMK